MLFAGDTDERETGDLVEYLHSLSAEGAVSSSGVFTIDVRAALPKLEKFQLPRPHFGVLKVIQSAIGSGATLVETIFGPTGITIEHDGDPPTADQLKELFGFLLAADQASGDRALRDLAIGVNTNLARGASWVEVAVRAEVGWVRQRWASRDEASQLESPGDGSRHNVRFVVRNTAGQVASGLWGAAHKDVVGMLKGSRESLNEDAQAVFDRCRYAPAIIRINGRTVPPPGMNQIVTRRWSVLTTVEHRQANLVEMYLQAGRESPHLMTAPTESQARHRFVLSGQFDGQGFESLSRPQRLAESLSPRRLFAIFALRGKSNVPGELVVVKDGVELTRLTPPTFPGGVSVVVTAEGLRLDMSQFRLVEAPETLQRLRWISETIALMARHAQAQLPLEALAPAEVRFLEDLARKGGC